MGLCTVKENEFVWRIQKKNTFQGYPLAGAIELTYSCNFKCIHCYVRKIKDGYADSPLSAKELFAIIDQLSKEGCVFLCLTGGEPFLRDDFEKIYLYARKKAFLISINTNGYYITSSRADFLKKYPPIYLQVSLHAITPQTYERITGVRNAWNRCLRGIRYLYERDVRFCLGTVVMKQNYHEVPAIRNYARKLGAPLFIELMPHHIIDPIQELRGLCLTPSRIIRLERNLLRRGGVESMKFRNEANAKSIFQHRVTSFFINPYGVVRPCLFYFKPTYSLKRWSFKRIWQKFSSHPFLQNPERGTKCEVCKVKKFCVPCVAWRSQNRGTDNYLCKLAHYRSKMSQDDAFESSRITYS